MTSSLPTGLLFGGGGVGDGGSCGWGSGHGYTLDFFSTHILSFLALQGRQRNVKPRHRRQGERIRHNHSLCFSLIHQKHLCAGHLSHRQVQDNLEEIALFLIARRSFANRLAGRIMRIDLKAVHSTSTADAANSARQSRERDAAA